MTPHTALLSCPANWEAAAGTGQQDPTRGRAAASVSGSRDHPGSGTLEEDSQDPARRRGQGCGVSGRKGEKPDPPRGRGREMKSRGDRAPASSAFSGAGTRDTLSSPARSWDNTCACGTCPGHSLETSTQGVGGGRSGPFPSWNHCVHPLRGPQAAAGTSLSRQRIGGGRGPSSGCWAARSPRGRPRSPRVTRIQQRRAVRSGPVFSTCPGCFQAWPASPGGHP